MKIKPKLFLLSQCSGHNTAGKHLRINVLDGEAFGYYRLVATSSLGTETTSVLSLSGIWDFVLWEKGGLKMGGTAVVGFRCLDYRLSVCKPVNQTRPDLTINVQCVANLWTGVLFRVKNNSQVHTRNAKPYSAWQLQKITLWRFYNQFKS